MKSLLTLILFVSFADLGFSGEINNWPEMSLFHLNDVWKNENSSDYQLKQMEGKPTLLIMAYTSCQHTCPMIISKTQKIWDQVPKSEKNKVQLILVSFDPKGDTPENLKKYKNKRKLGDEWTFLTGDTSKVRKLAAVLGINYKPDGKGDFSHSNVISLIDKNGVVVDQITNLGMPVESLSKKLNQLIKK